MTAYDPELRNTFDNANPRWHTNGGNLEVGITDMGLYGLRVKGDPDTVLVYYQKEWDAFVDGVNNGEFNVDRLVAVTNEHHNTGATRHSSGLPQRKPVSGPR